MLGPGNNSARAAAALSSDMPPLPQCLPLEPFSLGNQRYTRTGELRRVLGVQVGSAAEEHSFGASLLKSSPPVVIEELKHFKDSVQDASKKARDRAKKLRESICKLDKFKEALSTKKRQRQDISPTERSNGINMAKMGSQIHRNPHETMVQRSEDRAKNAGLNKRVRTSVADVRVDNNKAIMNRQKMATEKDGDVLSPMSAGSVRIEEKIRPLPAGGDVFEAKIKRKRSIGAVGNRVVSDDRDIKRVMQPKLNSESKLRSCDAPSFRSKSSPGFNGINKLDSSYDSAASDGSVVLRNDLESPTVSRERTGPLDQRAVSRGNKVNLQDDNQPSSPSTLLKGKVSRAPRTGSIMVLDSSSKANLTSGAFPAWEHLSGAINKVPGLNGNHQKRPVPGASSSPTMANWAGQRPHKNSRSRRANLVSPVSSNPESQVTSQGFVTPELNSRSSFGTGGSMLANNVDSIPPKIKREPENSLSPFAWSESEESGAGENKSKEKGIDSGEVCLPIGQKAGHFVLSTRKNKVSPVENGDGMKRQGRNAASPSMGRPGLHSLKDKMDNLPTSKPIQNPKPASEKNKNKSGRPPSKKLKDRKVPVRGGSMVNNPSSDLAGESDDDHDDLLAAACSARNYASHVASGKFWEKMESLFASLSSEDGSYLKQQLSVAEGLDESLSQIFGNQCNFLGALVEKESPDPSKNSAQVDESRGRSDVMHLDSTTPLYQRVLSALIEEDETEECYHCGEGKSMCLHYASDDSHCGSCNQMDFETKDRDKMESEVESNLDFQSQKTCLVDRFSYDQSVASNTYKSSGLSNSLHSSERWLGDDDVSHLDVGNANEICSSDIGHQRPREVNGCSIPSDSRYQSMSLDDKLLLELHSIGLYPEILPDLAEGEAINKNVLKLNEQLYTQVHKKKMKLGKIENIIQNGKDLERRKIEHIAMDQLVQMAYKKRLACRGSNSSKSTVRKVSRQVVLAFIRRTIVRCKKFEETGNSCFNEPSLQDALFSAPPSSNDAKSVECVGSGTASNTLNEASNHQAEARGTFSGPFERYDSPDAFPAVQSILNKGRKREAAIGDIVGCASSRVTSVSEGTGVRGKRSDRDQNKDNSRRTKAKPKQKNDQLPVPGDGPNGRSSMRVTTQPPSAAAGNAANEELEEPLDFSNLPLDLDSVNGLDGDLSWLNFDDEELHVEDAVGLEIPDDDISELNLGF